MGCYFVALPSERKEINCSVLVGSFFRRGAYQNVVRYVVNADLVHGVWRNARLMHHGVGQSNLGDRLEVESATRAKDDLDVSAWQRKGRWLPVEGALTFLPM